MTLNVENTLAKRNDYKFQKKIYEEVKKVLTDKVERGIIPMEQSTYLVCTKFGAATATIIPERKF